MLNNDTIRVTKVVVYGYADNTDIRNVKYNGDLGQGTISYKNSYITLPQNYTSIINTDIATLRAYDIVKELFRTNNTFELETHIEIPAVKNENAGYRGAAIEIYTENVIK